MVSKAHIGSTKTNPTPNGYIKYLQQVKGVGPKKAENIYQLLGNECLDIIASTPDRLVEAGLNTTIISDMSDFINNQSKADRDLHVLMYGAGVTPKIIEKIKKHYETPHVLNKVRSDPYALSHIKGVGFLTADKIALGVGVDPEGTLRVSKIIEYIVRQAAYDDGNTALTTTQIQDKAMEMIGMRLSVEQIKGSGSVVPFRSFWMSDFFFGVENGIVELIKQMLGQPSKDFPQGAADLIDGVVPEIIPGELTQEQRAGILQVFTNRLSVISGPPGVGKSAIAQIICLVAERLGLTVFVVAPTGRAAERIREDAPFIKTSTIHRRLGWMGMPWRRFKHCEECPLDADIILVDETSMMGVDLARDLLRACGNSNVCFIGDKDQLPSVEPGNFLKSLLLCDKIPRVILSQIFRQKHGSGIIYACHLANNGEFWDPGPQRRADGSVKKYRNDYRVVSVNKENWYPIFVRVYQEALDEFENVQVMAPLKRGEVSTRSLNRICQKIANPRGAQVTPYLRAGDRVIQIRNRAQKTVFNGDIGVVQGWDRVLDAETAKSYNLPEESAKCDVLVVQFGKKTVGYGKGELSDLDMAYACTVHKLQGGGFDCVICCIMMGHYILLDRNLIYTGMSRAKKRLVMFGEKRAMSYAVRSVSSLSRTSMLQYLLAEY